jgi:hypothetical protein
MQAAELASFATRGGDAFACPSATRGGDAFACPSATRGGDALARRRTIGHDFSHFARLRRVT